MSDLIDELLQSSKQSEILGKITQKGAFGVNKFELFVNKKLSKELKKEEGHYVTIKLKPNFLWSPRIRKYVSNLLSEAIKKFFNFEKLKLKRILVVGLGNGNMVCDSLGELVCNGLLVLDEQTSKVLNVPNLCFLLPSVKGVCGINSVSLISAAVQQTKPSCVVLVDSLTANDVERLGFSIQLSNAGIVPGAGVGQSKTMLNKTTLNVPVISVGVPMLISLKNLGVNNTNCYYTHFTPKEIDYVINKCANIISQAINASVYPSFILKSYN